jgi:hypothetical protein
MAEISGFSSPSVSSRKHEWPGILVEQRSLYPGIVQVPALSEHFLGLHLQQPLPIEFVQQRDRNAVCSLASGGTTRRKH